MLVTSIPRPKTFALPLYHSGSPGIRLFRGGSACYLNNHYRLSRSSVNSSRPSIGLTLARLPEFQSAITRCEDDVSRSDRFASHLDLAEARVRDEASRLLDAIKAVDRFRKRSDRMLVFLRSKRENEPPARSSYPMNFAQVGERIVPEIQSVHRIDAIERLICIWNVIAAGTFHFDQALLDRVATVTVSHLHHFRRDVDARNQSFRRQLCHPRARSAVAKPNLSN